MPGRLWDLLRITSSVSGSTTSETQKRCLDPLLPRCTCVSLHLITASSGFLSIFLHFTVTSLRARTLSYNCSSRALLRDRPRIHRCRVNVCWKTTTKISSESVLFVEKIVSNHLPWNFWSQLHPLKSRRRNICLSPENPQSCHVNPAFTAHSFYIWLPILPPSQKLSFFPLLVPLFKMLLINSGCNK